MHLELPPSIPAATGAVAPVASIPAVAVGEGHALIPCPPSTAALNAALDRTASICAAAEQALAAIPARETLTLSRDIVPRMAADIVRIALDHGEHEPVTDADLREAGWTSSQRQLYGAAALRRAAEMLKEREAAQAAAADDGGSVA